MWLRTGLWQVLAVVVVCAIAVVCVWPSWVWQSGLHRHLGTQGLTGDHTVPSDTEDREIGLFLCSIIQI